MSRVFLNSIGVVILFLLCTSERCVGNKSDNEAVEAGEFVCTPCGQECDTPQYNKGGRCDNCKMELVEKSTITHTDVRPDDLCSLVSREGEGNVLLLDVRTPAEFEGKAEAKYGRLKNAINIPIQELEKRMDELNAWKNKQIIVYCSHSHRSPRASYMISQKGFTKVTNMLGGMSTWKSSVKEENCNQKLFISQ